MRARQRKATFHSVALKPNACGLGVLPRAALCGAFVAKMVTGREARTSRNVVLDLGMLRAFHFSVLRNNVAGLICNCHVGPFIRSMNVPGDVTLRQSVSHFGRLPLAHSWHWEDMVDRYRTPPVARNLSEGNRGCFCGCFYSKAPLTDAARRHRCNSGYYGCIARERAVFAFEPRARIRNPQKRNPNRRALRFDRRRTRRTTHLVRSTVSTRCQESDEMPGSNSPVPADMSDRVMRKESTHRAIFDPTKNMFHFTKARLCRN
jgi:hypothetical protein